MVHSAMLLKKSSLILGCLLFSILLRAQEIKKSYTILWQPPISNPNTDFAQKKLFSFAEAQYNLSESPLGFYQVIIPLPNANTKDFSYVISNEKYSSIDKSEVECSINLNVPTNLTVTKNIGWIKKKPRAKLLIVPIRKTSTGSIEKLVSFDLAITPEIGVTKANEKRKKSTENSALSSGTWYKIGLVKNGIYKLDKAFFQQAGIDASAINPQSINIYGSGQGLIPFENSRFRQDDLKINRIEFVGEEDGVFNDEDYILFYANGPHRWEYNALVKEFNHIKHLYADTSYYFIGINVNAPYRIQNNSTVTETENTTATSFDDYGFTEIDNVNFIKSGRDWAGELFDYQTVYEFGGSNFNFPNIDNTFQGFLKARVFARTIGTSSVTSNFDINYNNQTSANISLGGVALDGLGDYAIAKAAKLLINPSANATIKVQFNKHDASSLGWLDYLEINVRRNLIASESQMIFRDIKSVGIGNITKFKLTNFANYKIWETTDPTEAKVCILVDDNDGTKFIKSKTDSLRSFIAFNGNAYYTPVFFGSIENQNLHALGVAQKIDMVIVAHPLFIDQANELADFHRNYAGDPLNVVVVTPQQVYNEFSSGMQDITAIKDLMRMLYNRASSDEMMPRYLLLFGDGSYNNKAGIENNFNFVPTHQTLFSTSQYNSRVSDDYYGLLDDDEGDSPADDIDIGIGRFPVRSVQEAKNVVKKTIAYMTPKPASVPDASAITNTSNLGNWRNILTYIGDDADNAGADDDTMHSGQANKLADSNSLTHPDYNAEKIIIDAYTQTSTPSGQRYPDVSEAIRRRVESGTLLITYVGHGGELGWASEKILNNNTIQNWTNINTLPIFLTATCEFSRFDDPGRTSAGEYVLLNGSGGGVALCTTTRIAYVSDNNTITDTFMDHFFEGETDYKINLGDVMMETKNKTNLARNFALLGDPALKVAYPEYNVVTESITDTLGLPMDTIKALNVVKLIGFVAGNNNAKLTNFNGLVYITVYDKIQVVTTLNNDNSNDGAYANGGLYKFKAFKNVLYKGTAKVTNGDFSSVFVVPKDINLNVDTTGRISYYATSGTDDANGHLSNVKIGALNLNAPLDMVGPKVELFMNDENFVFGGITSENPLLFAKVYDENGINTSGSGVGHDLITIINEDNSKALVLNDYYQSEVDSYKKGTIKYPFNELEQGRYTLQLKVWDTHNNAGDARTEFIVASSEEFALERILNYPNPFTTKTDFYFEHNQYANHLNVKIDVFTISGKLVKQINVVSATNGFRSDPISWDGRDDYGDKLARGVYIYKLSLRNNAGKTVEKFEKLVILN